MSTGLPSGTEDALRRGAIVCVYIAVSAFLIYLPHPITIILLIGRAATWSVQDVAAASWRRNGFEERP